MECPRGGTQFAKVLERVRQREGDEAYRFSEDAMLDAFIIEEIKRREQERQRRQDSERPSIQIPLPEPDRAPQQSEEEKPQRGVIIIDLSV